MVYGSRMTRYARAKIQSIKLQHPGVGAFLKGLALLPLAALGCSIRDGHAAPESGTLERLRSATVNYYEALNDVFREINSALNTDDPSALIPLSHVLHYQDHEVLRLGILQCQR